MKNSKKLTRHQIMGATLEQLEVLLKDHCLRAYTACADSSEAEAMVALADMTKKERRQLDKLASVIGGHRVLLACAKRLQKHREALGCLEEIYEYTDRWQLASEWKAFGFTPKQANMWLAAGVAEPTVAVTLKDSGISAAKLRRAVKEGLVKEGKNGTLEDTARILEQLAV